MRVLVAPDKFKGSLTAAQVAEHVAAGLRAAVPGVEVDQLPVADGGDGTVEAAASAGYRRVPIQAIGPTGDPVETAYAERAGVAVVELADVSGLRRLPHRRLAPLVASSHGTGDVLRAALDAGCGRIVLGVGGSASTDGGAGMVEALGARLRDDNASRCPRRRRAGSAAAAGSGRPAPCASFVRRSSSRPTSTTRCTGRRRRSGLRPAEGCDGGRRRRTRPGAAALGRGRRHDDRPGRCQRSGRRSGRRGCLRSHGDPRSNTPPGYRADPGIDRIRRSGARGALSSSPERARWTSRLCAARHQPA